MENKIELVCPECNEKFNVDYFYVDQTFKWTKI